VLHGHLTDLTQCEVAASLGGIDGTCTCLKVREAFKRAIVDGEVSEKSRYTAGGYKTTKTIKNLKIEDRKLLPKTLRDAVGALIKSVDLKRNARRSRNAGGDVLAPTEENRKTRDGEMSKSRIMRAFKASAHKFRGIDGGLAGYSGASVTQKVVGGKLNVQVEADWIRTVAIKGLANVDGHVVVHVIQEFTDGTIQVNASIDQFNEKAKVVLTGLAQAIARKIDGKWTLAFTVDADKVGE
jgi:hypothetical protein